MKPAGDILAQILVEKRRWVAARKQELSLQDLQQSLPGDLPLRDFVAVIKQRQATGKAAVIAEIKRASPSKGVICKNFDVAAIAKTYARHGACCLSVLTDARYFLGADEYLQQAKAACELPLLRKDFIIDEWQVYESRYLGADCILLIVAVLSDDELCHYSRLAHSLGMDVLIEVHDRHELERALMLRTPLIGINNRNLRDFHTDLQVTIGLLPDVMHDRIVVTESGIHTAKDVRRMRDHEVNAFLVGEALLRTPDPGQTLSSLFAGAL